MTRTMAAIAVLLLTPAAGPEMRAGEWEFSPPTTRYCFASDTPAIAAPQSLEGCAPVQISKGAGGFSYATSCSLMGMQVSVEGALTLDGPDAYTNTTHVRTPDGNETTSVTTLRRIGNCQSDDSPPP